MKNRPKLGVVFDCNILLQAVARKAGPAAACLSLAEEGFVLLLLSEEILTELSEVLNRPKIRARYPELTDEMVECCLAGVVRFASFLRYDRVRRTNEDHCRWQVLILENPIRLAGKQIVSGHVDEERFGPLRLGKLSIGA